MTIFNSIFYFIIYLLLAAIVVIEEILPNWKVDTRPYCKKLGGFTICIGCLVGMAGVATILVPAGALLYFASNIMAAYSNRRFRRESDQRAHG